MYRYNLLSTNESSQKYGNCEVCGKHATEVFLQSEERYYTIERDGNIIYKGWTQNKCKNLIGHKECLLNKQRN